jgi:hypothetical protein
MKFQGSLDSDEPEINLIAFIDILLVVLIFLMVTTTYSRFTELKVNLPTARNCRRGRRKSSCPWPPTAATHWTASCSKAAMSKAWPRRCARRPGARPTR